MVYDMEDLKYYVDKAVNDLNTTGIADFRAGTVVKVKDKIFYLKRDYSGWYEGDEDKPRSHIFVPIKASVEDVATLLILKGNGYHDGYRCNWQKPAVLFRQDALKLMGMGCIVSHERYYGATFKMVDGVIYDHWEDKDEPDHWEEFNVKCYDGGEDILLNDKYIGWTLEGVA